jgi:hypothetical protein
LRQIGLLASRCQRRTPVLMSTTSSSIVQRRLHPFSWRAAEVSTPGPAPRSSRLATMTVTTLQSTHAQQSGVLNRNGRWRDLRRYPYCTSVMACSVISVLEVAQGQSRGRHTYAGAAAARQENTTLRAARPRLCTFPTTADCSTARRRKGTGRSSCGSHKGILVRAPGVSRVAVAAVVRVAHPLSCSYRSFVWLFHTALDPAERWQVSWLTLWLRRPHLRLRAMHKQIRAHASSQSVS